MKYIILIRWANTKELVTLNLCGSNGEPAPMEFDAKAQADSAAADNPLAKAMGWQTVEVTI